MAKRDGTLYIIAAKCGLGSEEKVLSKAAEYERRLKIKSTASSNISDLAKSVFCLDFAGTLLGVEYDTKTLIKSSGLKPSQYTNYKKVVENLLELSGGKLTVPLLCAQLHCDNAQEVATKVLEQVRKTSKVEMDLNLPQYVCMAVYQACRINKIKISKSKLVEKSRLKPGQWSKMDAEWTKIVDQHFVVAKKKGRKANKEDKEIDIPEKIEIDNPVPKEDEETDPLIEPYEDWKRRILAAAYAALGKLPTGNNQVNDTHNKKRFNEKHDVDDRHRHKNDERRLLINDNGLENKNGNVHGKNRQDNDIKKQGTGKRFLFVDVNETSEKNVQELEDGKKLMIDLEKLVNRRTNAVNDERRQSPRKIKNNDSQMTDSPRQLTRRRQTNNMQEETSVTDDLEDKMIKIVGSPIKTYRNKSKVEDVVMENGEISEKLNFKRSNQLTRRRQTLDNKGGTTIPDDLKEKLIKTVGSPIKTYRNKSKVEDAVMEDVEKTENLNLEKKPIVLVNDIFNMSPRRSPRKTPQKFEPYKSPIKNKGVRMLFPCD